MWGGVLVLCWVAELPHRVVVGPVVCQILVPIELGVPVQPEKEGKKQKANPAG